MVISHLMLSCMNMFYFILNDTYCFIFTFISEVWKKYCTDDVDDNNDDGSKLGRVNYTLWPRRGTEEGREDFVAAITLQNECPQAICIIITLKV